MHLPAHILEPAARSETLARVEVAPQSSPSPLASSAITPPAATATGAPAIDFRALVLSNHDLAWRTLRRLGVDESGVDDAVQKVFLTVHAKLAQIAPGKERAFVVGVCSGIAANARRGQRRARRETELSEDLPASSKSGSGSGGEAALDQRRARQFLDDALNALTPELRIVFVLHELEGMTGPEIAECVDAPIGTVASRLRRARALILEQLAEIRGRFGGAP